MKKSSLSSVILLLLSCSTEKTHAQQIDEAVYADISELVMHDEFPTMKRSLADEDAAGEKPDAGDAADKPAAEPKSDDSGEDKPPAEGDGGDDDKPKATEKKPTEPVKKVEPAPAPKPAPPPPAKKSSEDGESTEEKSEDSDGEKKSDSDESGETKPTEQKPVKPAESKPQSSGESSDEDQPQVVTSPSEKPDWDEKPTKTKFVDKDGDQEDLSDEELEEIEEMKKPQKTEEELQAETDRSNADTKKDFETHVDTSEDFKDEYFKGYTSKRGKEFVAKLKRKGAIIELLEPRARKWISVPQSKNPMKRRNCGENEVTKSHYLTSQGSKNYVQWRVKRSVKDGNCTIKMSTDGGKLYKQITPVGTKNPYFQCGRKTGYEYVTIKLPKDMVAKVPNQDYVILQFEMYTSFGPIVQCADMIIQKNTGFQNQKCDPHCKNGGVCKQGKCICGEMFYGDSCEYKNSASGAFSMLLFILVIGLVIAGVGLLVARNNLEKQRQLTQAQQRPPPAQGPPM